MIIRWSYFIPVSFDINSSSNFGSMSWNWTARNVYYAANMLSERNRVITICKTNTNLKTEKMQQKPLTRFTVKNYAYSSTFSIKIWLTYNYLLSKYQKYLTFSSSLYHLLKFDWLCFRIQNLQLKLCFKYFYFTDQ